MPDSATQNSILILDIIVSPALLYEPVCRQASFMNSLRTFTSRLRGQWAFRPAQWPRSRTARRPWKFVRIALFTIHDFYIEGTRNAPFTKYKLYKPAKGRQAIQTRMNFKNFSTPWSVSISAPLDDHVAEMLEDQKYSSVWLYSPFTTHHSPNTNLKKLTPYCCPIRITPFSDSESAGLGCLRAV